MVYLERGRCCTQQGFGAKHVSQHDASVAGMIAWGWFLLLVTLFVLFIHDDKPQILEGQEDAGTDTQNQLVRHRGGLSFVHIETLDIREFGMIDPHIVTKDLPQPFRDLGGQRNLREQVEHLLSLLQVLADEVDVYLRFARRSDSMKERDILGEKGRLNLVHCRLLGSVERCLLSVEHGGLRGCFTSLPFA